MIASICTPRSCAADRSRSGSSPGSTMTAVPAAASERTMKAFSCSGPTVKARTSRLIASGPPPSLGFAALAVAVDEAVGEVADDRVEDEHDREEADERGVRFGQEEDHEEQQDDRREHSLDERRAPRRWPVAPVDGRTFLLRRGARGAALLGGGRLAPGASAGLDDAGGVAPVLGLPFALGLSHLYQPIAFSITGRAGSNPGIGISGGKPSSAARGARPTSSALSMSACRATAS